MSIGTGILLGMLLDLLVGAVAVVLFLKYGKWLVKRITEIIGSADED